METPAKEITNVPVIPVALPKILEPETVTLQNPPALKLKRQRSSAQIAWSKELGKNSIIFKSRKQQRLNNINPDRQKSQEQNSYQEQNSGINETQGENKFNSWYIIIPAGLAAACILWCKWGKYRVFKLSVPKTPTGGTVLSVKAESAKSSRSLQITEPSKSVPQLFEME